MPWNNFFNRRSSQAAAPPVDTPAPDPRDVSPWMAQNAETLDELARFIDFAEGFTLGFLEINFNSDFDAVLKALQARPDCTQMEFHTFILDDPNLRFLKDALEDRIQHLPPPISSLLKRKKVILVRGLENAIGLFGDYPPLLQDLNFVRDAWINSVPYPVLLCLPSYAINRLIQFAPDFWSWKSGVFRILSTQTSTDNAYIRGLHAEKLLGNLNQLERQERITLLEQLAQEFDPQTANCPKDDLRIAAKALIELGRVHIFAGEFLKSKEVLSRVTSIFLLPTWSPENSADVRIRINYLNWKAFVNYTTGDSDSAAENLADALNLNKNLDENLLATTFYYLSILKNQQGKVIEAINLLKQSLAIQEQTGNTHDLAASLHQLANIKGQQGQLTEAIDLCDQAFAVMERIGDAHGKATSLHQLAILKRQQGNIAEATKLFHQSLAIDQQIGDFQGIASSLNQLANLRLLQGDVESAIPLYQQALVILQRIGSPNAANVQATLDELMVANGNELGTTEES